MWSRPPRISRRDRLADQGSAPPQPRETIGVCVRCVTFSRSCVLNAPLSPRRIAQLLRPVLMSLRPNPQFVVLPLQWPPHVVAAAGFRLRNSRIQLQLLLHQPLRTANRPGHRGNQQGLRSPRHSRWQRRMRCCDAKTLRCDSSY